MPNQTPVSRYVLIGIAAAMLCSAVPEAGSWFDGWMEGWTAPQFKFQRSVGPLSPLR